jgi:glycerate 2-kinase
VREAESGPSSSRDNGITPLHGSVKALVADLLQSALAAVNPATAVMRQVRRQDDILKIGDRQYDLNRYDHVYVVGGGKAAAPMAQSIETILGDRLTAGVLNVKYGYTAPTRVIVLNQAGHPIPDERGVEGVDHMLHLLANTTERDLVICLISGGGSALMVSPVPGVTMADKRRLTDSLLRSGATINELNIVRKHLSRIKGGNLARFAQPADVVSLILSDVIGNHLDVIASGPTVADSSTFADAWAILEAHDLVNKVPSSIAAHLHAGMDGAIPETPKAGDPIFARTHNLVIGSNEIAARAALERARQVGLNTMLLSTFVEGEAREVGEVMAAIGREIVHSSNPIGKPACIIASGETTVTVRGQGRGGRNQELALAAAMKIEDVVGVVIVSAATDGSDGPTDAAGAIVTGETVRRAHDLDLDPRTFLADNDSYEFFSRLDDLIVLGPTNTNVNDLIFILVL